MPNLKSKVPKEVLETLKTLHTSGFEAYLVGGCVRDLFIGNKPKDWDITTNAKPEKITSLFKKSFYENNFGTVTVVDEETEDKSLRNIEITPYRMEGVYSDFRRPDKVSFGDKIEEDLERRDFTMNAIGYDPIKDIIVDPYKGQKDIEEKIIKTVGDPDKRFSEDGLRILRAVRFHVELGFSLDPNTEESALRNSSILDKISEERIKDEFVKIIMSQNPMKGIELSHKIGILKYMIPELEEGIGIDQNKAHAYDVWTHLLRTLQHSADKNFPLHVRLTALLHDISKPYSRRFDKNAKQYTFYGHEVAGSRVTRKILERLKFPKEIVEKVSKMVRWHMFFSDTELITHSAVRRLIANVGKELVWDLMNVRICDRIGTGRPKENPYRLRKYKSMVEEVMRDPVSVGMLKLDGKKIMEVTKLPPSPKIGFILHALLEEVLDNPTLNTTDYMERRAVELSKLPENDLKKLGQEGKVKKDEEEEKSIKKIRGKYWVK